MGVSNGQSQVGSGETYDALDDGVGHLVGVEHLGLGLATVRALGVPPTGSISVKSGTSAVDGDVVTRDRDKRTLPLLVAEGGGALEDDVGALLQVGQVEGGAGGNDKVAESDGRARLLVLDGVRNTAGAAEGAVGAASIERSGSSNNRRGSQCHGSEGREEVHSENKFENE